MVAPLGQNTTTTLITNSGTKPLTPTPGGTPQTSGTQPGGNPTTPVTTGNGGQTNTVALTTGAQNAGNPDPTRNGGTVAFPDQTPTTTSTTTTNAPTDPGQRPEIRTEDRQGKDEGLAYLRQQAGTNPVLRGNAGATMRAIRLADQMLQRGYDGGTIKSALQMIGDATTPEDLNNALNEMEKMATGNLDPAVQARINELTDKNGMVSLSAADLRRFMIDAGVDVDKLQIDLGAMFESSRTKISVNANMFGQWLKSVAIMGSAPTDRAMYDARMVSQNIGGFMGSLTNAIISKVNNISNGTGTPRPAPTGTETGGNGGTISGNVTLGNGTSVGTGANGTTITLPGSKGN